MKFKIEGNEKVNLFGKELSSLQFFLFMIAYNMVFLSIIWPIISHSYWFIPGAIAFVSIFPGEYLNDDFGLRNKSVLAFIGYFMVIVLTVIYTYFFLDAPWAFDILHFPFIGFFVYLFLKKY